MELEGEVCSHHRAGTSQQSCLELLIFSLQVMSSQRKNSLSYAAAGLEGELTSLGASTTNQDLEST